LPAKVDQQVVKLQIQRVIRINVLKPGRAIHVLHDCRELAKLPGRGPLGHPLPDELIERLSDVVDLVRLGHRYLPDEHPAVLSERTRRASSRARNASRIGPRLVPKRTASSLSFRRWPMPSSPRRMSCSISICTRGGRELDWTS